MLTMFISMLPWAIVACLCWVGFQLVQQNGRLLLRLEALEQQLAHVGASAAMPQQAMPAGLAIGSTAPAFELPDLFGNHKKLSDFLGKQILLIFFNPGCSFCQQMAPQLASLLPVKPTPLIVTTGNGEDTRKLFQEHGIRSTALVQEQMQTASQYQAAGTPMGYLIDEQGKIASPIAVGAEALLALAASAEGPMAVAVHPSNGHQVFKGNRTLADSHIKRNGLKPGTPAPGFRLPRIDGGELALEEYWGKRLLLLFSAPDCGPCNDLTPKLERLHRTHPEIEVLMVSRGDEATVYAKAAQQGLSFPVVLQRQWEISRLYAMFATPIAYLIDEKGVIASEVAVGEEAILRLVPGTTYPAQLSRAIA
jgi:peroxiredoxin